MNPLIGVASFLCLTLNMIFWSSLLFLVGLVRFIIPSKSWKKFWTSVTIFVGETCISFNNAWIKILLRPSISITGMENLKKQHWYVATSNHQSWGDIFILQKITNKKVPLLRFFMKDVLKWIPIVSIVGWALDMPFLKRYSKEQIEKNQLIKDGIFYFNNERFWESHEALEGAWKQCTGNEKELIQGIILVAAAFVHYQKYENKICLSVLGRALKKLHDKSGKYHDANIDSIKQKLFGMLDKNEITIFTI